ncbi:hypothetical protein T265_01900 [Opisthorchis viverrini]|uniref:Uncharacterized protein n=1 Tax=Opisthorchis viverrini TaxID=6198 RepID=A0A074ZWX6_OPIVI|nr:hypothetical protein T265_01900 [Opisthorchis viverrini]KER31968.1 hypothetical protein T265_01900 [Opisthorchis viverrini]
MKVMCLSALAQEAGNSHTQSCLSESVSGEQKHTAGSTGRYWKYAVGHGKLWGARWLKWLEREFTDRKVRDSNPISASRLPLSRLGQPSSIPVLVLPSGSMAARRRKGVTAERWKTMDRICAKLTRNKSNQTSIGYVDKDTGSDNLAPITTYANGK